MTEPEGARAAGRPGSTGLAARLHAVRKRFGYRDVLRGIDLEVPRGSCFVIQGPNGAGKSSLLRVLSTQWTFNSGEVEVLGMSVRAHPIEVKARLGMVFHESFLRRELSLDENLSFTCDLFGLDRWEVATRIDDLLARFGLAHRRRDPVGTYSQGMSKRASIVRSLIHEPEVWLLDEPFSGLDRAGQRLLEGLVREFVAGGRTAILVTHDGAQAARLATESARIEEGVVARRGPGAAAIDGAAGGEPDAGEAA
jgi:ABC-type multidrug transport system ATPase subunit